MGGIDFPLAYFLPATLGACAVMVSILGSFLCKFVSLREVTANRDVFIGVWLRTQLYFVNNTETTGEYNVYRGCGSYPSDVEFDGYWNSAKAFAVIAAVVGTITVSVLIFAACLPISGRWWNMLAYLLVLTSLFQGLVFLFLRSNACGSDRTVYTDLGTLQFADGCSLASGANLCIAGTVLWFLSGILVCFIPCPNEVEPSFEQDASAKKVPVTDDPPLADDEPADPAAEASATDGGDEETP